MVSGGDHPPRRPSPVSGPGALSRRTDSKQPIRSASGGAYGDRKAMVDQEHAAPLAQVPSGPPPNVSPTPAAPGGPAGPPQLPPFGGPSTRPDEPVTHGVDIGAGGGLEAMPVSPAQSPQRGSGAIADMLRGLSATDTTGDLAQLYQAALTRGV